MIDYINKVDEKDRKFFSVGFYNIIPKPVEVYERSKTEAISIAESKRLKTTVFVVYEFYKTI
jgi:hypothetical protein|tara:strand:- start:1335 stop:1520 length:186 start_codon:yes stop_codon:yes gene_type:complete